MQNTYYLSHMDDKLLKKAKKKVQQKKAFYIHTGIILAVSVFLMFLAFFAGGKLSDIANMSIPIAAMLLSVAIHYVSIWGVPGLAITNDEWEANELEKEYFKLKRLSDTKKNLSDKEYLELRELETRYKDDDFV